jgi:antitoxin (DNA-binding transcriptional repressor) of toxin-antitoxin stability system
MVAVLTVAEAQATLKELIETLAKGDEIVLTENEQPVAKLIGERGVPSMRPAAGLGKGSVVYMAPDFDEPLEEFKEYVERGCCLTPTLSCGSSRAVQISATQRRPLWPIRATSCICPPSLCGNLR